MFKLRGCPKCRGDLYVGEDIHGVYLSCIQCGRYYAVAEPSAKARRPEPAAQPAGPPVLAELELAA